MCICCSLHVLGLCTVFWQPLKYNYFNLLGSRYRGAKYCVERVFMPVCMSVPSYISTTSCPDFTKFYVSLCRVTGSRGLILWRQYNTLYRPTSRSRMLSPVRLSAVALVHPTQPVEIFGNVSTPFGTLAIRWHPRKILRRSSQGNPSVGGEGVNARGVAKYSDFGPIEGYGPYLGNGTRLEVS